MKKEVRYDWNQIVGTLGEYRLISKNDLRIDTTYQRGELSNQKILTYASTWDWALCGMLMVADREGVPTTVGGCYETF